MELESSMCLRHRVSLSVFAMVAFAGVSSAHSPPEPQIHWVQSPQMATSLARQFRLPILVFVTSDSCYYCRKMEQEVWSNPQIISMVEAGFIPLELNAKRDAELVAALGIRSFPTILLFTQEAKFVTGAPGYLPLNKLAGLLRSVHRQQPESQQVAQNQ
jgi:thioredoxin-related protein